MSFLDRIIAFHIRPFSATDDFRDALKSCNGELGWAFETDEGTRRTVYVPKDFLGEIREWAEIEDIQIFEYVPPKLNPNYEPQPVYSPKWGWGLESEHEAKQNLAEMECEVNKAGDKW